MGRHVYDYGIIGNCAFSAHIKTDTNIAWMCWPRFDSSFIFGNLVDEEKGGEFSILPENGKFDSNQYYIENTNVLCTEIECSTGKYKVTDFAPRFEQFDRYYKPLMMIRKIEPISGQPQIKVKCNPKGDYGNITPERSQGSNHIRFIGLDAQVRLTTNISLNYLMHDQEFVLNETKWCVLTYGQPMETEMKETSQMFLNRTVKYWRDWIKTASVVNFYQKAAIRSALALKIHQYEDTGAIVAALTTSLPESPQSTRNWDYRFCWMRDTYYTLNAFNNIGHFEELEQYFHYIQNILIGENDRYQPLVGIGGEKKLVEIETSLAGYQGDNKPVRVGNQAYEHIQNDVYGQVLVSLLPLYYDQRIIFTEKFDSGNLIMKTLKLIEATMEQKDAGLWEFRNLQQYHCYTYLFHWAGCLAAEKIAEVVKDNDMAALAGKLKKIAKEKVEACYVPAKKGYAQAMGTDRMDASCLQLINMNYLKGDSEVAKAHLQAMEKDLLASNGLFYRYKHQDDFGEPETTFLICAFWYVEALACVGRIDEAIKYFDNLASYSNHVGLLSEDVKETDGSMWGNFPQAYSHVGLLNAANRIAKKLDTPDFCY
ncbi:glycoside hydrolase family 15 protein [Reichenbachiella versicolor]|uniref:glycoside hydrolase family 15 protein n=1 Tax=Reichenbachiella versicolor TaxID=1821036 RepID=UPI000D6E0BF3|nr:glycoside hydrolase family 15 protein [Reichenbachiella versicolor]